MKKNILSISIIISSILISGVLVGSSLAQTENKIFPDINYPVEELGGCENVNECRIYCDKLENLDACLNFAEKKNLMSEKEISYARKFKEAGMVGPGGCQGEDECDKYCDNINHMAECISFAEENGLMDKEELEEAKKVRAAIDRGVVPPACSSKKACDIFCSEPENIEACMNFAIEAGFMDKKEIEESKKVLVAIKKGAIPPACRGEEDCDRYCSEPEHMEECMIFSLEAGFMSEEEKEDSLKMLTAIKKGINPPSCHSEEECDIYCSQESHMDECINFAEAAGFMTREEAEMTRKTRGEGPGGCKSVEECDLFCGNPNNAEVCFNFGKEHGLIPPEELRRAEEDKQKMRESFGQIPQEVLGCLNSALGIDVMEKIKSGTMMPNREFDNEMRKCFEKFGPPMDQDYRQGELGMTGEMPIELKNCIIGQIGEEGLKRIQTDDADEPVLKEKIRPCFEKFDPSMDQDYRQGGPGMIVDMPTSSDTQQTMLMETIMSQETIDCLKTEVGEEMADMIKNGTFMPTDSTIEKAKKCFEGFDKGFDIRIDSSQMDTRQQDYQIVPTQQMDMMEKEIMEREMMDKKTMEGIYNIQDGIMTSEQYQIEIKNTFDINNSDSITGDDEMYKIYEKEMYERKIMEEEYRTQNETMSSPLYPMDMQSDSDMMPLTETQQFDPNMMPPANTQQFDSSVPYDPSLETEKFDPNMMPPADTQQFDSSIEFQIDGSAPSSFIERLLGNVLGILSF
jgi:hypothetical protein